MKYRTFLLWLGLILLMGCNQGTQIEERTMDKNQDAQAASEKEEKNLKIINTIAHLGEQYVSKAITAEEFAEELSDYMTEDVVFWSNFKPKDQRLAPLFIERKGIDAIMERYDYESKYEKIKEGTGLPTDISVNDNVIYYSQNETASFFGEDEVTWTMVTKITIENEKINRLEMYLDSSPIDSVYY